MLEHVSVVVYSAEFDEQSTLRSISPHIVELTGRTPEELLADDREWYRCIHPDDLERVREAEAHAFSGEVSFDCSFRMVHRDGRVFDVWERDVIMYDENGAPTHTQGVLIDVTALLQADADLRSERDRAQRYLDVAGTTLLAVDTEGRVTMLNRAGYELLGYEEGELQGVDFFEKCLPHTDRDRLFSVFSERMATDTILGEAEIEVLCRDGSSRLLAWHTTVLREQGKPVGLLSSGVDITERRRAEEQIAYLAYHDSLTGLPNRAMLRDHLDLALARATRHRHSVALLYLDLDDFKLVNDGLGHAAGDTLLRAMAHRLRHRLRDEDLIAREGGDEFLILLADLDHEAEERALAVGEILVEALRVPFRIGETEFEVNGSIGISVFPRDAPDAEALLAHADTAMYAAKRSGRGQVRMFKGRRHRSSERLSLSRRLRRALEEDELILHWQPIITVESGVLKGLEALVRWQEPQRGLIAAAEFIDDMDRVGLLETLDEWVAGAFTEQRRAWQTIGLDPYVGFNLGAQALNQGGVERLIERLSAGGMKLDHVTIELSESDVLRDDAVVHAALTRLHEAGITLALDDFGVAYSSLSRLRDLPAKWVKVDRSFLVGVPADPGATRVLDAILQLLDALELRLIVEGVESAAQANHLRERAVETAQGFYYGRPAPAAELEDMIRASPEQLMVVPTRS